MPRLLVAILAIALAVPALAALAPGDYTRTLSVDGHEREFLLHVPPGYDGTTRVPLVLDFHGWSSAAIQQRALSGMVTVSDEEGFILAHPQGLDASWNAGICCSPNRDLDDVGFIRAVVEAIAAETEVDRRRIYATGLSNGGAISQRLACEAADLFAATAPMAFPIPLRPLPRCHPSRPIPVLTFMGLTDILVRYEDGAFGSAPETFAYWHDIDGCVGSAPDIIEPTGASRCEYFTHCRNGVEAGLCSITAQDFPGAFFSGHILYLNEDLDLARVAWDFLKRFRLPDVAAPREGQVRGSETLGIAGRSIRSDADWVFGLGRGIWWASAGDATLSGTAKRRGSSYALTLTDAARAALASAVSTRASSEAGTTLTLAVTGRESLRARVDSRHIRVRGRLHLTSGSTTVQYDVRLGGPLTTSP